MAGGTSAFDMIKRLKENENLRKKKYFKNKNKYSLNTDQVNTDDIHATEEQREEVRRKALTDDFAERKRSVRLLLISLVIVIVLIPLFMLFVNWLMN